MEVPGQSPKLLNPLEFANCSSFKRLDALLIASLIAVFIPLRLWQLNHTEVAARDSIGYIRTAWQLGDRPWREVVRNSEQHPGYPLAILGMSKIVRLGVSGPDSMVMQYSAQFTSIAAGLLLIAPMYLLGRNLFGRAAAFWASAFFQLAPAGNRVLPDALSEGLFLLFAVSALLFCVNALRSGSFVGFGLTGMASGLAYLVRPEGALIAGLAGLVLLVAVAGRLGEFSRQRGAGCALVLIIAWAAVSLPYINAIGGFTVKLSSKFIINPELMTAPPSDSEVNLDKQLSGIVKVPLAIWLPQSEQQKVVNGLKAVGFEIAKGFGFIAWIPAILGMYWGRGLLRTQTGAWVLLLLPLVLFLLLWRLAAVVGYVSERHTIMIILCGCYPASAATLKIGAGLGKLWNRLFPSGNWLGPAWPSFLGVLLLGSVVPKSFEPLHANRSGFKNAGLWLAENSHSFDQVLDPYCWAHYYAGRVFLEGRPQDAPPGREPICFVVLEQSGNSHLRLTEIPQAKKLAQTGRLVFEWEGKRRKDHCVVRIYACALPSKSGGSGPHPMTVLPPRDPKSVLMHAGE